MTGIATFWRTVRHLKSEQVIGRLRFRLLRPVPDLSGAPPLRAAAGSWVTPAAREPSLVAPSRFRFLNVERDIDSCGWDDQLVDRLWRYNLHYFDDLNAGGAELRTVDHRALVTRWILENPPGRGTGWEPYPVSLRTVNWIKWFLRGVSPDPQWQQSLAVQVRWLSRRLEFHLLGNHLFVNAKALIFAGLWFGGDEAERWVQRGFELIRRELPEQVLSDGGQVERSPMYHALALEDVLDIVNVVECRAAAESPLRRFAPVLRESASRMLHWLRCMCHPDGSLGLFNDAADGIAPALAELERYAADLGIQAESPRRDRITHLAASGYVRVPHAGALALLDIAPVGPDHMPGHAHADTLSFELSIGSQRLIVNGGTSCYGQSPRRLRERGTAAHSTVEVAGENSSEVWSGFRVGRRARPFAITIGDSSVCSSHDGYRFLRGRPDHRRCWYFAAGELVVDDAVSVGFLPAVARYILAPSLRLHVRESDTWEVRKSGEVIARVHVTQGEARAAKASHSPQFGTVFSVDCLDVALVDGRARTQWTWKNASENRPQGQDFAACQTPMMT